MIGYKAVAFLGLAATLTACGGSKGGTELPVVALSCATTAGAVFVDGTCPDWQDPSAFEQNKNNLNLSSEYLYGMDGELIIQKIIDSGDPKRNEILDIQYGSNQDLNGIPRFLASANLGGNDMSDYATGKLKFDLNVKSLGDPSNKLLISIPCGWPCTTTDRVIETQATNQWKSYEIPVAELIRDGLSIEKVQVGFQLFPTWGNQSNAHFQVDNIRWEKGTAPVTTRKCFAEHFDALGVPKFFQITQASQPEVLINWPTSMLSAVIVTPQWEQINSRWGLAITDRSGQSLIDLCSTKGVLTASVSLTSAYIDDGRMNIGLYFIDNVGTTHTFAPVSVATFQRGASNTLSVNLPEDAPYSSVTQVGVYFDGNGKPSSVTGPITIDNFVITQPL
jgi:Galactose-binding domain-like